MTCYAKRADMPVKAAVKSWRVPQSTIPLLHSCTGDAAGMNPNRNSTINNFIFRLMARKKIGKSAKITPWEIAWELRTYPAQLLEEKHKNMTRADVVFALMMWLGMSKIDAYLTAYPTNASRVSVAAMATRKSQEEWITDYLDALWKAETDGKIKFIPLP